MRENEETGSRRRKERKGRERRWGRVRKKRRGNYATGLKRGIEGEGKGVYKKEKKTEMNGEKIKRNGGKNKRREWR